MLREYYEQIVGIEKDYRLSKVSQVAAFMYGMDGIHIHYGDGLQEMSGIQDILYLAFWKHYLRRIENDIH